MKLTFLGAAGEVTGSKSLLELEKEKYLIDYGMFQGSSSRRSRNWESFSGASGVTAVLLTHAHIDHCGLLPRLWKDGFRGTIYCTKETYKLCRILLEDSAKINEEDAAYANKKKYSRHKPALPLYTHEEVKEVLKRFKTLDFDEELKLSKNLQVTFCWAGHILGASFIRLRCRDQEGRAKTIVFSGDVGHKRNILLSPPKSLCQTDILVLESTYGNKLHPRIPAKEVLGLYLNTILQRSGTAIIPSFSVGRTQDVLYLVKLLMDEAKIPRVPVFLDSPLSKKANQIFNECFRKDCLKEEVQQLGDIYPATLKEIETVEESKELTRAKGPMIIISASGMLDGGRVIHHVKNKVSDKKNGIILVGFQPEGTKGHFLINGVGNLRLHKQEFPVEASIFYINSLSAHADYLDMFDWIQSSEIRPELVILNHGEKKASQHLKTLLESEFGFKTTIAENGELFDLAHIH